MPKKTLLKKIQRGLVKNIGAAAITCLSPPLFIEAAAAENNHSMVLRVDAGASSFLFSGDIEKEAESELVSTYGPGLAAAVLKLPHHGSRTSSSAAFLDAAAPRVAVISLAAFNSYGFPHREVVERLKQRGIRWLITARRGGIMIASGPAGLEIEVSK
jgi:competence protein ComEC